MSTQEQNLQAIAEAIRQKEGSTGPIPALDFAARILAIPTGSGPGFAVPLVVTVDPGALVTAVNGSESVSAVAEDGTATLILTAPGTWTVTASIFEAHQDMLVDVLSGYQIEFRLLGRLPIGYTECEYIRSDGTQYIDTEVEPDQDTRVVIDFIGPVANTTARYIISAEGKGNAYQLMTQWGGTQVYDYYGISSKVVNGIDTTVRVIIDKDKNILKANGVTNISETRTFSIPYHMYIFAQNSSGNTDKSRIAAMTLYSCQVYNAEKIIRDFVPCKNPSGEVGLFDLVTDTFFGNKGTGTFTAGPAV